MRYEITIYEDEHGDCPFADWLKGIKDIKARAKIHVRIDRISLGNFGDTKPLKGAKGIYELREHYGQGFRIYYAKVGTRIVLLLAGSTKRDQEKVIKKTQKYLEDYYRRKKT